MKHYKKIIVNKQFSRKTFLLFDFLLKDLYVQNTNACLHQPIVRYYFLLKFSGNFQFSDDFRRNKNNSLNIRSKIWGRSLNTN